MQKWADDVGDDSYMWENILPYYQKSVNYTPPNTELRQAGAPTISDGDAFVQGGGPLHVR